MITISEKEHLNMIQNIEMIVRSDRVFETVYDKDSPEVIEWTRYFTVRANIPTIFSSIETRISCPKFLHAEVVGTFWHHFSALGPQVMSLGAAKVDNNLIRHYIVQILFEELGTRNHRLIHPDLFLDTIESIGVRDLRRNEIVANHLFKMNFDFLISTMNEAKTNSEILGVLLGLEINANENIQTIFDALSYNNEIRRIIQETPFFKIHRIAEDEHIRIDVANFLRFCQNEQQKSDFIAGFDKSVLFWKNYWNAMARVIDLEVIYE